MPLVRLALAPGIDKQNTEYGAEGGWIDGDYIRFRYGLPEKIGGWRPFNEPNSSVLIGMASEIFTWNSLQGTPLAALGTHRKLYALFATEWYDITPIVNTSTPGGVTFAATDGSPILSVAHTSHNARLGAFVTYTDAGSLGGNITADILNREYEITNVIDNDNYEITASVAANSSDTGDGGALTVGSYQLNVGSDVSFFDYGWGIGTWGLSTWGTPRPQSVAVSLNSRVWQFDAYGEDLICQLVDGGIYRWSPSNPTARAQAISGAPTKSTFALVSTPDRHLICFGTEETTGVPLSQDPMLVRFSSQEDIENFVPTATNTAGGQRLTDGNKIMSAIRSRGQILIFTDTSLHAMQFLGPPFTFGFQQLGANCGCVSPHAAIDVNGLAFWMGKEAFYVFDGTVKKLPSTVQDFVFQDLNLIQAQKVVVGLNTEFNEITWWYCSFTSDYIDRFVTYNYLENVWSVGSMARTAWQDVGTYDRPTGVEYTPNGTSTPTAGGANIQGLTPGRCKVYSHEVGLNAVDEPITAFIQSGYFDISEGDNMLFMKRFIPDFKEQQGNLVVNLLLRPYPQATASPSSLDPYVITPTTQKVDTRARGRQISLKITSTALNTQWRYGTLRVDVQPDGLR
jgi:hypothetical protein